MNRRIGNHQCQFLHRIKKAGGKAQTINTLGSFVAGRIQRRGDNVQNIIGSRFQIVRNRYDLMMRTINITGNTGQLVDDISYR